MSAESTRDAVWRHIRDIKTCMMVTSDGERVRARPMRGISRPEQNAIWFFSDVDTHKDEDLKQHPSACLAFADLKSNTFVSVSGRVVRIRDRDMIHGLWSEGAECYFPKGPDDPKLVLLRFDPEEGEYWDGPSSPIVLAIKFLAAKITGERPDMGSNASAAL